MLLESIGQRLRRRRRAMGLSQVELSRRTGVSPRFLSDLELGRGNISVQRLAQVCAVLELPLTDLFRGLGPGGREKIALIGLRGAGKSTIGRVVARQLGVELIELDTLIEQRAGMSLGEIFVISGELHYRELEVRVLREVLGQRGPAVLATGGSIVTAAATWALLKDGARTVWLRASPRSHLRRVRAQGDLRPMAGRPNAQRELEAILAVRRPLYAQAELALDTDALGVDGVAQAVLDWIHADPPPRSVGGQGVG